MYVDCNYQPCDGRLILATGRCINERRDMYNDLTFICNIRHIS